LDPRNGENIFNLPELWTQNEILDPLGEYYYKYLQDILDIFWSHILIRKDYKGQRNLGWLNILPIQGEEIETFKQKNELISQSVNDPD